MTALLAIDPGVAGQGCACAAFYGAELTHVWFERAPRNAGPDDDTIRGAITSLAFDVVVVERPVYQGNRTLAARDSDLMALAWEGAMLAGMFAGRTATVIEWPVNDAGGVRGWKGSEPKPIQHARLWAGVLEPDERALLGGKRTEAAILEAREKGALSRWSKPGGSYYKRAFTTHNLLDAVALGCTYLGRLERTG